MSDDSKESFIQFNCLAVEANDLPVLQRSQKRHFFIFLAVAIMDIAFHAAAGVAAAAAGAHTNGSAITPQVLKIGAVGGLIRAGISIFCSLALYAPQLHLAAQILISFIGSTYGSTLLITISVTNSTINQTPGALLIAAVVTAVPLCLTPLASRDFGESCSVSLEPTLAVPIPLPVYFSKHVGGALLGLGFTPLSGYVFARVANQQGFFVCNYNAGASAGAAFAAVLFFEIVSLQLSQGMNHTQTIADSNGYTVVRENRWGRSVYRDPNNIPLSTWGGIDS